MTMILIALGVLVVGGIAFALGRSSVSGRSTDLMRPPPSLGSGASPRASGLSPQVLAEVQALIAANCKIDAVKLVRESTGLGLKEAKDVVESL